MPASGSRSGTSAVSGICTGTNGARAYSTQPTLSSPAPPNPKARQPRPSMAAPTGNRTMRAPSENAPMKRPTNSTARRTWVRSSGIAVTTRDCGEPDKRVAKQTRAKPRVKIGALRVTRSSPLGRGTLHCLRAPKGTERARDGQSLPLPPAWLDDPVLARESQSIRADPPAYSHTSPRCAGQVVLAKANGGLQLAVESQVPDCIKDGPVDIGPPDETGSGIAHLGHG
jgi:hypothetical protein